MISCYQQYPKQYSDFNDSSFQKLLSLYNFNKQTNLIDLHLTSKYKDVPFYKIDGLLTKYNLDAIIKENIEMITDYTNSAEITSNNDLGLHTIHENDNFILGNLNARDYDFLHKLIDNTSKIFKKYYLDVGHKDINKMIKFINEDFIKQTRVEIYDLEDRIDLEMQDYKKIYECKNG